MSDHPKIHTTESGTQYVLVADLVHSKAGWAEIQRILDAGLVSNTPPATPESALEAAREILDGIRSYNEMSGSSVRLPLPENVAAIITRHLSGETK